MIYKRIAVASNFSPTFADVLAEAMRFARQCEAVLEVIHAAAYEEEKERRFREAIGSDMVIRWIDGATPAAAIAQAASDFHYDLVIAGALAKEDGDRPFTNGVARQLIDSLGCDLLLLPGPVGERGPLEHFVFVFEPAEEGLAFIRDVVTSFHARKTTIVVAETPFTAALAASRGEEPHDVRAWSDGLVAGTLSLDIEAESWIVNSNTGYALCDAISGLNADLLVVKAELNHKLPVHVNWLHQVIPCRLLIVAGRPGNTSPG